MTIADMLVDQCVQEGKVERDVVFTVCQRNLESTRNLTALLLIAITSNVASTHHHRLATSSSRPCASVGSPTKVIPSTGKLVNEEIAYKTCH